MVGTAMKGPSKHLSRRNDTSVVFYGRQLDSASESSAVYPLVHHLYTILGDARQLVIPQSQVKILHALRCCSLEQVVEGAHDDRALARAVHLHATHAPPMPSLGVLDVGHALPADRDKRLVGVLFLVQLPDVGRAHGLLEWDVGDRDDAREPRRDGWDKGDGERVGRLRDERPEAEGCFPLVNVVGERVGANSTAQVVRGLRRDLVTARVSGGLRDPPPWPP